MAFLKLLGAVEIRAVVASIIAAAILALVELGQSLGAPPGGMFTPYESARIVFLPAATIGAGIAMLYGAPLYAILFYRGLASWPAALLLGLGPGAAIYFLVPKEQSFAVWVACGGGAAAFLTHLSMRRSTHRPRSNPVVEQDARQEQPRASHHEH